MVIDYYYVCFLCFVLCFYYVVVVVECVFYV